MGLENIIVSLGLIIILLEVIAIIFHMQMHVTSQLKLKEKLKIGKSKDTTYFLDEGEDEKKCEICYGIIGQNNIAVCKCEKIFHEACAKPTECCPYCGTKYEDMIIREPTKAKCPVCGKFVKGNMCECGAILPRKDNTFLCMCGNRVDVKKPVCKKCGAVYEPVTMQTLEGKK